MTEQYSRPSQGVIQNNDTDGYKQYVFQRNLMRTIKAMEARINILEQELANLKQNNEASK
jgi:hypothetical protein